MKIYYLDDSSNVYYEMWQVVGKLGVNNLFVNEENKLVYNGNIVGVIGGKLNDIANDINKSNANVRTLKKDSNAGFGQVVVLTLVLICLGLFIAVIALSLFSWFFELSTI